MKCDECAFIEQQEKVVKALKSLGYEEISVDTTHADVILVDKRSLFGKKRYFQK